MAAPVLADPASTPRPMIDDPEPPPPMHIGEHPARMNLLLRCRD